MSKLISPSDLRAEAQRLIAEKMPTLDELLAAIAEIRHDFVERLQHCKSASRDKHGCRPSPLLAKMKPVADKVQ